MNKFDTEIQAIATRSFVQDRVPNFEEKLFGVDLTGWKVYNAYISLLNDDTTKNDDDTAYLASFMKKMKES